MSLLSSILYFRLLPSTKAPLSGDLAALAPEFAYRRFRETKCSVYWIHADDEATFVHDYEALARRAGLADTLQGKDLLRAVREWIEEQPCWLLVVDNADNLDLFGVGDATASVQRTQKLKVETCLDDYIPRAPFGTVLWTSRDKKIVGSLVGARRGVPVGRMTIDEATALFEVSRNENASDDERAAVSELLIQLDRLALAVSQAAAYIRRASTPVAEYRSRLKEGKKRWKILKKSEHDRYRRREAPNSILETWTISMDHLKQENLLAYKLLLTLVYVHNQNIPEALVRAVAKAGNDAREKSMNSSNSVTGSESGSDDDSDALTNAVVRLREFSFLTMRKHQSVGPTYEMHKLVQDAARYSMSQELRKQEAAHFSKTALILLSDLFPLHSWKGWEQTELWLPYALQSSEWAEACNAGADNKIASLLSRVSVYLFERGRLNENESVQKRVYSLQLSILGKKHSATISSLASLASTHHAQGRYNEAEKTQKEVLQLSRKIFGENHPTTLRIFAQLTVRHYGHKRTARTKKFEEAVLQLSRERFGNRNTDTMGRMGELASTYFAQGRYDQAEKLQLKVLYLHQKVLGRTHPNAVSCMASLASTYDNLG
ncbi:uncharacterized protein LY79DRAFT_578398 [Colletotrichum navitas]|uniref:Kinesin light chain n=1 Tax=Colletotrichum navitas TaxID=681940 RepID=A0AAD8Q3F0_9PEZI|nr:uncharacterized protein LY79DRAFT_578398 [Colletotrichum navitas]KAK1594804.1 hypothetical protein LY79DRAFT_578398 [Colletotrichum navitas]